MAPKRGDDPQATPASEPEVEIDDLTEAVDGEIVDPASPGSSLPGNGARMTDAALMLNQHQGPLPSKEWFTTVENLAPGTTKDLVADYIAQREHQRTIQAEAVQIDRENFKLFARYQSRQLLAAWTTVTLIGAGGIVLIAVGHSIAGLVALVAELAILAGVFVGRQVIESKSDGPPTASNQKE